MADPINITPRIVARLYAVPDPPAVLTPRVDVSEFLESPVVSSTVVRPIRDPLLDKLKEHIVQIEAMLAYIILFLGCYAMANAVFGNSRVIIIGMSLAFLAGASAVVRVTNPSSEVRNRFVAASSGASLLVAVGAAIFHYIPGGWGATEGGTLGGAVGVVGGWALGDWLFSNRDKPIERGEAFSYLHERRHKCRFVANSKLIETALKEHIASFDMNSDGRCWYAYDDLDVFLKNGPPKP